MSQMIYAPPTYDGGMTVQVEWLEPKKLQITWTATTDGVDQQYHLKLQDYAAMNMA